MSCRCAHLKRLRKAGESYKEQSSVYMDYNAAAPPDRRILALYQNEAMRFWAHPSSPHLAGAGCDEALEGARSSCVKQAGGRFIQAVFTSGSTEAIRRILEGTRRPVITSCCDHTAVLEQAENPLLVPVDSQGKMDAAALEKALTDRPGALILYSPVNHETGARQDCRLIWELAAASGALVFIDGAQAAVRLEDREWKPFCHGFCLSIQKLYGLKGHGLMMTGEELSAGKRGHEGTPDVPGALALTEAMRLYGEEKEDILNKMRLLSREGWNILSSGRLDPVLLSPGDAAPGVLCLALPELLRKEKSMEALFYHLNLAGICLSRFSACNGSIDGASPVLKAMGYPRHLSETSLRISLGRESKREHFFRLRKALETFLTTPIS